MVPPHLSFIYFFLLLQSKRKMKERSCQEEGEDREEDGKEEKRFSTSNQFDYTVKKLM